MPLRTQPSRAATTIPKKTKPDISGRCSISLCMLFGVPLRYNAMNFVANPSPPFYLIIFEVLEEGDKMRSDVHLKK